MTPLHPKVHARCVHSAMNKDSRSLADGHQCSADRFWPSREKSQRIAQMEAGIAQMEAGIAVLRVNQTKMGEPHRITLLADAYGKAGEIEKALWLLEEALVKTHKTGERLWEAETQRLKGELLLRREPSKLEEARTCFRDAIGLARSQSAKSLELRATMSLARLLDKQGNRDEARTMLSDIYGWFTEGFDTADLKDAKVLLDALSA